MDETRSVNAAEDSALLPGPEALKKMIMAQVWARDGTRAISSKEVFQNLVKQTLEALLEVEMEEHPDYPKHARPAGGSHYAGVARAGGGLLDEGVWGAARAVRLRRNILSRLQQLEAEQRFGLSLPNDRCPSNNWRRRQKSAHWAEMRCMTKSPGRPLDFAPERRGRSRVHRPSVLCAKRNKRRRIGKRLQP